MLTVLSGIYKNTNEGVIDCNCNINYSQKKFRSLHDEKSGLCLDIEAVKTTNCTKLALWHYTAGNAQKIVVRQAC